MFDTGGAGRSKASSRARRSSNCECVAKPLQARDDGARHHGRRQLAGAWQQDRAGLVGLADDARPARRLDIVEELDQLVLDEAALLLDDQNIFETLREGQRALRLQRPSQPDFIDANAERGGALFGDAELGQCLPHVEIGFAGGDDAEARLRRIDHHAVEAVGARERLRPRPCFGPCRRRSCSTAQSMPPRGQRICRPPGGISKSRGIVTATLCGST